MRQVCNLKSTAFAESMPYFHVLGARRVIRS